MGAIDLLQVSRGKSDFSRIAYHPFSVEASMKVYNLRCEHEHRFEGWFSSEDDFLAQAEAAHITCPMCESSSITRLPSAPRLSLTGAQEPRSDTQPQAQSHFLDLMRKAIANTEDVGERFVEEARRIHYNEAPERAIRGVATAEECEALADEGIDVMALPVPAALKQPLQ
jgi:hypothetical protein